MRGPGRRAFAPELARRSELVERLGDGDRAVALLKFLHDRQHRASCPRRPVESVDCLEPFLFPPETDLEAPRLIVGGVRRRRDLAIAPLPGEPGLDVVLLRSACPEI